MMRLILPSHGFLTFFVPYPHCLSPHTPLFSILKEMENGLPSACVIWLKLLWFPLRKGWQSPQCWLALRAVSCSYLPSWQQVLQAGRQAGAGWQQGMADLKEIEILWQKPGCEQCCHRRCTKKIAKCMCNMCVHLCVSYAWTNTPSYVRSVFLNLSES